MTSNATNTKVLEYLAQQQRQSDNELASEWSTLEDYYNKRLWHQITLKLLQFVKHSSLQKGDELIKLYNNFIASFESKINPLSLIEIIAFVIEQFEDKNEAIAFLEKMETKVKSNTEASTLCKVFQGKIYLEQLNNIEKTKAIIEEIESSINDADGVTPFHGRFYSLASNYYRIQSDHALYYRSALRYLGCIELDSLSLEKQQEQAYFLGLAALIGENVYNLGELLAHPVLETLAATENAWLIELLRAFNSGDIQKFETMKPEWSKVSDLASQELKLRLKISLLCLMEITFKRPAHDRQLSFAEISKETKLPLKEVELLVMKALSQGLVKGAIDEVDEVVNLTWVQPRVLNRPQIAAMVDKLDHWCKQVNEMERTLEHRASEILTL